MPGSRSPRPPTPPPTPKALVWIERLIWILIYGGLLAVSLGLFLIQGEAASTLGYVLLFKGGTAAAAGVLLIGLRSRWP